MNWLNTKLMKAKLKYARKNLLMSRGKSKNVSKIRHQTVSKLLSLNDLEKAISNLRNPQGQTKSLTK